MRTMEEKMDQEREEEDARRDACLEVARRLQSAAVQAGKALEAGIRAGISDQDLHEVTEKLVSTRINYLNRAKEAGE